MCRSMSSSVSSRMREIEAGPRSAVMCAYCGEEIEEGEIFLSINGDEYCEACADDMTFNELVRRAGGSWKKLGEDGVVHVIR